MADDEIEKTFKGDWGTLTQHADGSITGENETTQFVMDEEGSARIKLKKITKVAIDNIVDVQSHTIQTDASAISHHIVYRNGGEVRFSYRLDGRILELNGSGLSICTSKDGAVTFSAIKEPS
jgi:hypothetical protein